MTINESRLRNGTLTFTPSGTPGTPEEFSCQATDVHVTPSYEDDGDAVETLCGDTKAPGKKGTYVLAGTVIQDFDIATGFIAFTWEHETETVGFEWVPNDVATGPTITGSCVIVGLEFGGEVNTRLTTDFEFDTDGKPDITWGTGSTADATTEAPAA
jgi:hypothetical protein